MGRNNRDYKIKDKNLTKSKKNAKLNKSIAFTLAGMAAIGAGAGLGGQNQEAQAMMGRVGNAVTSMTKNVTAKLPMTGGKITSSLGTKVGTSRLLNGAPGAINSGRIGKDGTQFAGLPKTSTNTTTMLNKNTNSSTPKTYTSTLKVNLNSNKNTNTSSGTLKTTDKGTSKLSNVNSLGNKTKNFEGGNAGSLTLKDGKLKEQAYSQKGNTGGPVFTTEGAFRK